MYQLGGKMNSDLERKRHYPVHKANKMIQQTSFNLSAQEYDLLQYIVMQIKKGDTELKAQEISISDFCKVANIRESGKNYTNIKKSLKSLADKSVWVELEDRTQLVRWIEDPSIEHGSGRIKIQLKKIWEPFLLELKEYYTVTTLQDTLPMKSVYGKRVYELLWSYLVNKKSAYIEFTIEELKKILLGEDEYLTKYRKFYDFKINVIEPAMADIRAFGNIDVNINYTKLGRSYNSIQFEITIKSAKDRIQSGINAENFFSSINE